MKYTDGQVTYSSSQIIDLEANNHKPSMENIPLSTYATAQAQPCDTAWPGSPEEQTSDQEQTKALEPRPTLAPSIYLCLADCWYIVDKASAMR
ncbi:hypothetical protein An02g04770 [Aspergillus niger]|uniref:Uncharacterized protein n=2 Tax=Aspergillus niger TaxID=5061 RepID=A2QCU5_ASPNC|nr:hypothetical protein An02g04770 [Aspergillus niger]CAK47654.1 hypothetical protein An02g04770 [Aspergillus niger]